MLPLLAMLVAGYLAKPRGADAEAQPSSAQPSSAGGELGGLASMLDLDGDGNPLDDVLRMIGRVIR
jgi:hypothetical protein